MTNWLVNRFVKNSEDIENPKVRSAYGMMVSLVGIVCNIILFGIKILIGLAINSISVMADAFNNLSDATSSTVSFVGVRVANRPADEEHPFGHGRYEYISALIVAFLVLQVGFNCFKNSFQKIIKPEELNFQPILLLILSISILIKIWLALFNRKLGKRINSSVMKATSADAFGDTLITTVTVLSVIIGRLTGLKIDGYMGVIVSVIVIFAGINIAKDTFEPLIGEAVSPEVFKKVTNFVESYDGILGSHDLIVHNYGPSHTMATIHAEVSNTISFERAHETIDQIEKDILKQLNIFLVIHMDPIDVKSENVVRAKELVLESLSDIDSNATIHDFRMVNGEEHCNLIFDLVVPHSYTNEQEKELLEKLNQDITSKDCKYHCVVTVENSYITENMQKS
ncbi:MAG TPA: cation diffusion facilitator family transporter [Lachnospiraceae bacterium]|nr:cation diffusion facilitator family transporter [Lachnospiraceae bacterium]